MPTAPSERTGTVYTFPLELEDGVELKDWQKQKLSKPIGTGSPKPPKKKVGKAGGSGDGGDDGADDAVVPLPATVAVVDFSALIAAIADSDDIRRKPPPNANGEVSEAEKKLRAAADASTDSLMHKLQAIGWAPPAHTGDISGAGGGGGGSDAASAPPVLVVLVGPQCIWKSTATRDLTAAGMASCSADTHMKAAGGFDYRRLSECHQACQRDAVAALLDGRSAVIDNTNMRSAFRADYFRIAEKCGAKYIVHAFSPGMWLTCTAKVRADTTDALALRAERRAASSSSEFEISADVIERTIDAAVTDMQSQGHTLSEWCAFNTPMPKYEYGVTMYHGALVYRDAAIEAAAADAMKTARFTSHKDVVKAQLFREIRRGFGEYHITILSPQEVNAHEQTPEELVIAVGGEAAAAAATVVSRGIGRVVDTEDEFALFLVYSWDWCQEYRERIGLGSKDCHVTLAFSNISDIHDFPKDAASCSW